MKFSPESLDRSMIKPEGNIVDEKDIIDVDPDPENKKFETPVMVVQGWGRNGETFRKRPLEVLANQGRRVLAFDSPRKIKIDTEQLPPELPMEELQKAGAIIDVLNQKGIEKTDAIAWSEGGLNLAMAAYMHPERFRNLVLVEPAGMIGRDSLLGLAYRFCIKENRQSKIPRDESIIGFIKYIAAHPMMCLHEMKQISEADIYELLKALKKAGIGISVVFGTSDQVFPMDRVQETYSGKRINGTVEKSDDILDGFYSVKGTHGEFIGHGEKLEPEVFPKAVGQILTALEKKTEKPKT